MASDTHTTGARPCAPTNDAAAGASVPSPYSSQTPFRLAADRYYRACAAADRARGENDADLSAVEIQLNAAINAVDATPCATWRELVEAWEIGTCDGDATPGGELFAKLIADRRRLEAADLQILEAPESTALTKDWRAALRSWKLADQLYRSNGSFGHLCDIDRALTEFRVLGEREHGSFANACYDRRWKAEFDRLWEASQEAGEQSFEHISSPADRAAIALVLTPAPTIEAVDLKIAVAEAFDLNNHVDMPEHPFDVIEADVRRLRSAIDIGSEL